MELNLYGKPSGTYYYLNIVIIYMKSNNYKWIEHELCIVYINMKSGTLIVAFPEIELLATEFPIQAMNYF